MPDDPASRIIVPYITAWSAERTPPPVVAAPARAGIAYPDEHPQDRDSAGVLWARAPLRRGRGQPELGRVHPLRQRRAMRRLLCQICGEPADRNEQGVLWLLGDDRDDWPRWPEDMAATHPPVCLPCARRAVRLCPYLRGHHVAARVREFEICGVYGGLYRLEGATPMLVGDVVVSYEDPRSRWVRAAQLVRRLHGCTLVDLEAG